MNVHPSDFCLFEASPGTSIVVQPDAPRYTVVAITDDLLAITGLQRNVVVGQPLFEIFTQSPQDLAFTGETSLRQAFEIVASEKKRYINEEQRYDITNETGSFTEKYWRIITTPVLDNNGSLVYIINTVTDITTAVITRKKEEAVRGIERNYNIFMGAPVIIAIIKGQEKIIELANEKMLEVWGRGEEVIGRPLKEAIPELEEQGFIDLLDQVMITGQPYHAYEIPTLLNRNGKEEILYFDFIYQPYYDDDSGQASGVIGVAHDVTEQLLIRRKIKESEIKYRTLIESMNQGFCILEVIFDNSNNPIDYRFIEVNSTFEKQTGLINSEGKTVKEMVPDIEEHWIRRYGSVVTTGSPLQFVEESQVMGRWFDVHAFRLGEATDRKVALFFTDITDERRRSEQLVQSEQRFRRMVEKAPVAMNIVRGKNYILEVANARMLELLGRTADGLLNKPVFETLPETRDNFEPLLQQVYNTGERIVANEYPLPVMNNGKQELRYINFVYEPITEDGITNGLMTVAVDVTELVQSRKKIEESRAELQMAIDVAELGTFRVDLVNDSATYSARVMDWFGFEKQGLDMNTVAEFILDDDRENVINELKRSHRHDGEGRHDITYRVVSKADNQLRYLHSSGKTYFTEDGEAFLVVGVIQNITQQMVYQQHLEETEVELQRRVQERTQELQEQKNLLDNILGNSSNGISVTEMIRDENGEVKDARTIMANDAAVKYTGLPRDLYLSVTATQLDPSILQSEYGQICLQTLATGEPTMYQYYLQPTGRWLELTMSKLDDDHLIHIFTDITPIKEAQLKLEHTIDELKRSNTNLEQFAYAASHDLKEPIRKILVFIDKLKTLLAPETTEKVQGSLQRIETASIRMNALIDDLLAYSQLNTGVQQKLSVNLNEVVSQVLQDLDLEIEEKEATIEVAELPMLRGNPRQLQQAFQNLIGNALKYTKPGAPPRITIKSALLKGDALSADPSLKDQEFFCITVADNGIGFDAKDTEYLFNVFTRLHTADYYKGTGLGLAIVRKIAENHNGFVGAESIEGEGARFRICLPAS